MIFGIGTDIVDVKRIKKMESIDAFAKKILGEDEYFSYQTLSNLKKIKFLSIQFAGKEAFAKAIGTGISGDISFSAIQIERDSNGKPIFNFNNQIQMHLDNLGITHSHVSLSDEEDYAIAFVVLEK